MLAVLGGCASQLSTYVRADGGPIDAAQEQATMAQCKGEASTTVNGVDISDPLKRHRHQRLRHAYPTGWSSSQQQLLLANFALAAEEEVACS